MRALEDVDGPVYLRLGKQADPVAGLAVTLEAHYAIGGLGSFVAELMADRGLSAGLVRCGVTGMPRGRVGSQDYLQTQYGLNAEAVAERSLAAMRTVTG